MFHGGSFFLHVSNYFDLIIAGLSGCCMIILKITQRAIHKDGEGFQTNLQNDPSVYQNYTRFISNQVAYDYLMALLVGMVYIKVGLIILFCSIPLV